MTPEEGADLLKAVLRRPVAYHRAFAEITGKVSAGLMLSQAWYWTPRVDNEDGWFYKTRAEWQEETGMTRTEQETARKRLVSLGLMEETLKGMPGKLHFRVNTSRLVSLLVENLPTGKRKTYQQVSRKAANMVAENLPTSITESTSETKPETSKEPSPHSRLMAFHFQHLAGPIPDPEAQGRAIKWLLATYKPESCEACYSALLKDSWRSRVSWLTVRSEIGAWLAKNGNGHRADSAPVVQENHPAEWYIRRFQAAIKLDPGYTPHFSWIADKQVKQEVLRWWMTGRTQDEINAANTCGAQ